MAVTFATTGAPAQQRQARPISGGFQQIESSGGIDVYLTQGPAAAVAVETIPDALPHIVTEVHNGTLYVYWERGF